MTVDSTAIGRGRRSRIELARSFTGITRNIFRRAKMSKLATTKRVLMITTFQIGVSSHNRVIEGGTARTMPGGTSGPVSCLPKTAMLSVSRRVLNGKPRMVSRKRGAIETVEPANRNSPSRSPSATCTSRKGVLGTRNVLMSAEFDIFKVGDCGKIGKIDPAENVQQEPICANTCLTACRRRNRFQVDQRDELIREQRKLRRSGKAWRRKILEG